MRWPLWLPTALLASFGSAAVRDLGPASPSVPERLPSLLSQPVWTLPTPELTADRPQPETVHPLIIEPLWFERRMVSARTHVGKPKREVVESFSIRWNIDDRRDKSRWTSSMEKAESFFERLDKTNTSKGVFAPAQRRVIVTARGKNDAGSVVGSIRLSQTEKPFYWRDGLPVQLPILSGGNGSALAISEKGNIAGWCDAYGEDDKLRRHAVAWVLNQSGSYDLIDLNDLVADTEGWRLSAATKVDDQGLVFGEGKLEQVSRSFKLELRGIDGSVYTGPINPAKMKQLREHPDGRLRNDVFVAQAFGGKRPNRYAEQQLAAARFAGMRTGAYVFLNFRKDAEGRFPNTGAKQVEIGLRAAGRESKYLSFVAIDVERHFAGDTTTQEERVSMIADAVDAVREAGKRPIIYTAETDANKTWSDLTGDTRKFKDLPVWTPRYSRKNPNPELHLENGNDLWRPFGGWEFRHGKQFSDEQSRWSAQVSETLAVKSLDLNTFTPVLFTTPLPKQRANFVWPLAEARQPEWLTPDQISVSVKLRNYGTVAANTIVREVKLLRLDQEDCVIDTLSGQSEVAAVRLMPFAEAPKSIRFRFDNVGWPLGSKVKVSITTEARGRLFTEEIQAGSL